MRKSQEKREREKGTTETSKRITRRNNKLTDCEKGKRKREGQREKGRGADEDANRHNDNGQGHGPRLSLPQRQDTRTGG